MTLSIALMAVGSGMIAVTPGYATIGLWAPVLLVLARLLQGFAVGGEVGPATMFILEAAPKGRRMLFASWQLASQNLGSLASGLIGFLLALALTQSSYNGCGWRVPFAIGVLDRADWRLHPKPARRNARPVAISQGRKHEANPVRGRPDQLVGATYRPCAFLRRYDYPVLPPDPDALCDQDPSHARFDRNAGYGTLGITGGLGALAGGFLADRWGIRPVAIAPRLLFMLALFPVMQALIANPSAPTLVLAIACLSLLHAMSVAVGVILIPLVFPAAVRATVLAITYSLGVAIFGGTATYIVTWLVGVTGKMAANVVMLLAVLAVRQTDFEPKQWPPPVDRDV